MESELELMKKRIAAIEDTLYNSKIIILKDATDIDEIVNIIKHRLDKELID